MSKHDSQSIYRCEHCKAVLGVDAGQSLIVGSARIMQPVRLSCAGCGRATTWRPSVPKDSRMALVPSAV